MGFGSHFFILVFSSQFKNVLEFIQNTHKHIPKHSHTRPLTEPGYECNDIRCFGTRQCAHIIVIIDKGVMMRSFLPNEMIGFWHDIFPFIWNHVKYYFSSNCRRYYKSSHSDYHLLVLKKANYFECFWWRNILSCSSTMVNAISAQFLSIQSVWFRFKFQNWCETKLWCQ